VLLELSRTLNSVIDGNVTAAPEDILRDISRIVSLEIGTKNDNVYEYICPSWVFNDKNPTVSPSCVKNVPSKVNPINSKLCVSPRCLYKYNSTQSAPSLKNDRTTRREGDSDMRNNSSLARKKPCATESKYSVSTSSINIYSFLRKDSSDLHCLIDAGFHQCRLNFLSKFNFLFIFFSKN